MEALLKKYSPVTIAEIEGCYSGAIDAFQSGELSVEYMERLVRFAATNGQIKQHGLAPLPLLTPSSVPVTQHDEEFFMLNRARAATSSGAPDETAEPMPEECKEIGLTEMEYSVLKGGYGTVMGVSVNKPVYKALLRKCKTKEAISLKQNEAKTKTFMIQKMKRLASKKLRNLQKKELMATINAKAKFLIQSLQV